MSSIGISRPSVVAPAGLAVGFTVAQKTGKREAGGAVFGLAGGWCFYRWYKDLGLGSAIVLALIYINAMGLSHPLAKKIGAWPAVGAAAASVAVASEVATSRSRSKTPKVTGIGPIDAVLAAVPVDSVISGLQRVNTGAIKDKVSDLPVSDVSSKIRSGLPVDELRHRLSDLPVHDLRHRLSDLQLSEVRHRLSHLSTDDLRSRLSDLPVDQVRALLRDLPVDDVRSRLSDLPVDEFRQRLADIDLSQLKDSLHSSAGSVSDAAERAGQAAGKARKRLQR